MTHSPSEARTPIGHVLVTGGSGFVGNALAIELARTGWTVRALVRPESVAKPAVRALQAANVEVVAGTLFDPARMRLALEGCTHVAHLAAQKTVRGISTATYHAVNVGGTSVLATAALESGVSRMLYTSTLGVHGFVTSGRLNEESVVRPNTDYRRSKWRGEELLRDLQRRLGLPVVVARVSTVVGPGALSWLPLAQAIAAQRFRLIGDGSNCSDLVALHDMVAGLVRCLATPGIDGQTFVLGSASPTTLVGFAATIASALGVKAPRRGPPAAPYRAVMSALAFAYRFTGLSSVAAHNREVLVANKVADSARARAAIGYDPVQSIDSATRAMIADFVAQRLLSGKRA